MTLTSPFKDEEETDEESMNILESHIEGAQEFEPRKREQIYRAIIEYLYYGYEPDYLQGGAKGYFIGIKPTLDTHHARRQAGLKGGRPKKQTESNPDADGKPTENQTESKPKANGKQKESDIDIDIDIDIDDSSNDESNVEQIPYADIIAYLNEQAVKSFKVSKKAKELIRARWNDGYRLDDFKKVIDNKCAHWLDKSDMRQYLQPSTLFAVSHFDEYLNQTPTTKTKKGGCDFGKYAD